MNARCARGTIFAALARGRRSEGVQSPPWPTTRACSCPQSRKRRWTPAASAPAQALGVPPRPSQTQTSERGGLGSGTAPEAPPALGAQTQLTGPHTLLSAACWCVLSKQPKGSATAPLIHIFNPLHQRHARLCDVAKIKHVTVRAFQGCEWQQQASPMPLTHCAIDSMPCAMAHGAWRLTLRHGGLQSDGSNIWQLTQDPDALLPEAFQGDIICDVTGAVQILLPHRAPCALVCRMQPPFVVTGV